MTEQRCDVSWLRLERYLLGELEGPAAEAVARSLETCAHCQAIQAEIAGDGRPLPELPPLPVSPPVGAREPTPAEGPWRRLARALRPRLLAPVAVLALALLVVAQLPDRGERVEEHPGWPPAEISVKGGTLAVELAAEPGGDRLQVRLTCPPGSEELELVFFEGHAASFPLALPACGNRVVAGAVRAEVEAGSVGRVCIVQGVPRGALEEQGARAMGFADAACVRLPD